MLEFERPNSIREAAYKHLRDSILTGFLLPGKRISEPAIAEQLGLSRTPIREALQYLAKEGLVEMIPHRGARVKCLSFKEIKEVYEVRAILESEGARLAAIYASQADIQTIEQQLEKLNQLDPQDLLAQRQSDMAFHAAFVAAGKNQTLERLFNDLQGNLALLRNYTSNFSQTPETQRQHLAIVEAIRDKQAEAAAKAAREHVLYFLNLLLDQETGGPGDQEN
jgi:DNA-binding GntR family transcriptional regulator